MAGWEERFDDYVERLGETLGQGEEGGAMAGGREEKGARRATPTGAGRCGPTPPACCPGERKSVEPMAARVDPARVSVRPRSIPVGSTTTTCSGRRSNGARSSPATARGSSVMDHLPCGITS